MNLASIVTLVFSVLCLALALVFFVRAREWTLKTSLRLNKHEERLDRQRDSKAALAERVLDLECRMTSKDAWVRAATGAQIDRNIEMDGVKERIDALSARLDAVELACGIREKAKTMGGHGE